MHAIYERIVIAGPEIVGVRLTASGVRARIGAGAAWQRLKWRARQDSNRPVPTLD